jgi:ATP-dependent DNA helicase DinG
VYLEKNDGFQFTKRKMLIRLQQGIGRLIRNQDDKGICVILDKRLEKYKGSKDFAEAYREKIEPVSLDELVEKLKLLEKSK